MSAENIREHIGWLWRERQSPKWVNADWAQHVRPSGGLISIVVMTLFCLDCSWLSVVTMISSTSCCRSWWRKSPHSKSTTNDSRFCWKRFRRVYLLFDKTYSSRADNCHRICHTVVPLLRNHDPSMTPNGHVYVICCRLEVSGDVISGKT